MSRGVCSATHRSKLGPPAEGPARLGIQRNGSCLHNWPLSHWAFQSTYCMSMPCSFFAIRNVACFKNLWPLTSCMTFWLLLCRKDTQIVVFSIQHGVCLKFWIDLRQLQDGSVKPNEDWELRQGWNTPQTSLTEIPTWARTWHSPPGHSPTKRIHTAVIIESEKHTILRLLYRDAYGSSWLSKFGQSRS